MYGKESLRLIPVPHGKNEGVSRSKRIREISRGDQAMNNRLHENQAVGVFVP